MVAARRRESKPRAGDQRGLLALIHPAGAAPCRRRSRPSGRPARTTGPMGYPAFRVGQEAGIDRDQGPPSRAPKSEFRSATSTPGSARPRCVFQCSRYGRRCVGRRASAASSADSTKAVSVEPESSARCLAAASSSSSRSRVVLTQQCVRPIEESVKPRGRPRASPLTDEPPRRRRARSSTSPAWPARSRRASSARRCGGRGRPRRPSAGSLRGGARGSRGRAGC